MTVFDDSLNKFSDMLGSVLKNDILVHVFTEHDENRLFQNMRVYVQAFLKKEYPVKFYHHVRDKQLIPDLEVVFSCFKADYDDAIIEKTKKRMSIIVYFRDRKDVFDAIRKSFIPAMERFKEKTKKEPLEMTMCIPPCDQADHCYKQYIKNFDDFKKDNHKMVLRLREQYKGTNMEKFYS